MNNRTDRLFLAAMTIVIINYALLITLIFRTT